MAVILSTELLIALIAIGIGIMAWAYGFWCHRALNHQRDYFQEKIIELEKQLAIVTSGSIGIGQRIMALEQRLRNVQDQQNDIRQNDVEFSYLQAQKLIEQGVDAKTVAANSGLSPSEVNLMLLMHQQTVKHHH